MDSYIPLPKLLIFMVCFFLSFIETPILAETPKEWLKKAEELDKEGFLDEAVEAWKTLPTNKIDPKLITYAHLKMSIIYLKLGQHQKSIDTAKKIVQYHPDNFDAYFNLGNSFSSLKRFSEAIEAYQKTTKLRPKEGLGYVGLGLSLFGNSNSKKAIETLLTANRLFKKKKNISWYRDTRVMVSQIKHFSKFPPSFSNLWLKNNLKVVHDTYEKTVFNSKLYLR